MSNVVFLLNAVCSYSRGHVMEKQQRKFRQVEKFGSDKKYHHLKETL